MAKIPIKRLIVIGVIVSIILFVGLEIELSYRYFLSMLIVFIGLLIVFYKNKYELEKIKLQGEQIELAFFNKVFFKRKPILCLKHDIEVLELLLLYRQISKAEFI